MKKANNRKIQLVLPRQLQRGCFCLTVLGLIYLIVSLTASTRLELVQKQVVKDGTIEPPSQPVVIYAATKFFKMDVTTERFLSECRSSKGWCSISENREDFPTADAVLFHNADFDMSYRGEFVTQRNLDTPYVLWSLESPANDVFRPREGFINWTMTYRRASDIWHPYGHIVKRDTSVSVDFEQIWSAKNQSLPPVTWLASNCFTANGRGMMIGKLRDKGLKIDAWGKCGKPPPACDGVDKQSDGCVVTLIKPYKFYLSFENSNCLDYVTEKTWETLRSRMAVPLVIDRKMYEDLGVPPSAFIAMSDFSTVQDAVDYINEVASDKDRYLGYHKWREEYEVIPEHNDRTGFCLLCIRLAERRKMSAQILVTAFVLTLIAAYFFLPTFLCCCYTLEYRCCQLPFLSQDEIAKLGHV